MRITRSLTCLGICLAMASNISRAGSPEFPTDKPTTGNRGEVSENRSQRPRADGPTEITDLRSKLRKETGLIDVTPEAIHQLLRRLQEEREQLRLDDASAQGRQKALADALAHATEEMKERAAADGVAKELEVVVRMRQNNLDRMTSHPQEITGVELDATKAEVAQAKAQFAAAKQALTSGPAAEAVERWNLELAETVIAAQQRRARLDYVERRLATFSPELMDRLDQLSQLHDGNAANNFGEFHAQDH